MRIKYPEAIGESVEELTAHDHRCRGRKAAIRLRLFQVLTSGQAQNLDEAAALVGYSSSQVVRWWQRYRDGRLAALEHEPHHPGQPTRLTPEARADLHQAMRRGEVATLADARRYLRDHWGIAYQSINGVWWQLRQERTRKKTGRRRQVRANTEQQDAFPPLCQRPSRV
jgi:transposase